MGSVSYTHLDVYKRQHISNKKYCICNMQFEKEEYFAIKKEIIKWIMNS